MPKDGDHRRPNNSAQANNGGDTDQGPDSDPFGLNRDLGLRRARMSEPDARKLDAMLEAGRLRLCYRQREQDRTRADRVNAQTMKLYDEASASGAAFDLWTLTQRADAEIVRQDERELREIKRETRALVNHHVDRALSHVRMRKRNRTR